jgi:hypothetical protein
MACERPSVVRYCSEEAAVVLDESMSAALDLVAPECEAVKSLTASAIVFKAKHMVEDNDVNTKAHIDEAAFNGVCSTCILGTVHAADTLANKEQPLCSSDEQEEVDKQIATLYALVQQQPRTPLPLAFSFSEQQMNTACDTYTTSLSTISNVTKQNCRDSYEAFYQVRRKWELFVNTYVAWQSYNTFDYPCDESTRLLYARNSPCLRNLIRSTGPVRECEAFAASRLRDESNDVSTECTHTHHIHSCARRTTYCSTVCTTM